MILIHGNQNCLADNNVPPAVCSVVTIGMGYNELKSATEDCAKYHEKQGDDAAADNQPEVALAHYNEALLLYPSSSKDNEALQRVLLKKARNLIAAGRQNEIYGVLDGLAKPNDEVKFLLLTLVEQYREALHSYNRTEELGLSTTAINKILDTFYKHVGEKKFSIIQRVFLFHQIRNEITGDQFTILDEGSLFELDIEDLQKLFPVRYLKFKRIFDIYNMSIDKSDNEMDFQALGQDFTAEYPNDSFGYQLRAYEMARQENWQELATLIDQITTISPYPDNNETLRQIEDLMKNGYAQESLKFSQRIYINAPDNIKLLNLLLGANFKLGRYKNAIESYKAERKAHSGRKTISFSDEDKMAIVLLRLYDKDFDTADKELRELVLFAERGIQYYAWTWLKAGYEQGVFSEPSSMPQQDDADKEAREAKLIKTRKQLQDILSGKPLF
jgi:tetratricopeptide (TPR) repeat protein